MKRQVANLVIPDLAVSGDFLLLHRQTKKTDWWEFPGGKQESWESSTAAAIREGREELGIETDIRQLLGRPILAGLDGNPAECKWWLAVITEGIPRTRERIHSEFAYKNLGAAGCGHIDLSPSVTEFVHRYQNGEIMIDPDSF